MALLNERQWDYILNESWPAQAVQGLLNTARMPGDAYMGKYAGQPTEAIIPDATDFAMNVGILGAAVPRPSGSVGMGGMPKAKISELFTIDNPSYGAAKGSVSANYITRKISSAANDMKKHTPESFAGKGLRGPATAYTKKPISIRTDVLGGIKGALDEMPTPNSPKYQRLLESVGKNGWQGDKNPILIEINHKGIPYIVDGNHRAALARDLGVKSIPAEIRWKNGAEMVSDLKPDEVLKWISSGGI